MRKTVDKKIIKKWKNDLEKQIKNTRGMSQVPALVNDSLSHLVRILNDDYLEKNNLMQLLYDPE